MQDDALAKYEGAVFATFPKPRVVRVIALTESAVAKYEGAEFATLPNPTMSLVNPVTTPPLKFTSE